MRPPFFLLLLALVALNLQPCRADDPRGDYPDAPPQTPAEEQKQFHLPPGFEIQLVASEPEIQKPINLNFDAQGRLWVTGSEQYPWPASVDAAGTPIPNFNKAYQDIANAFAGGKQPPPIATTAKDTIRILSDFDEHGHARKIDVFADGLNIPSGIQPLPRAPGAKGDTAIVYSIPYIWRMEDTDGDGKADKREILYGPFGFLDTHGGCSSYIQWIDGWIYATLGFRNHSEVRDRAGKVTVFDSGNTIRFRPDGSRIEYYTHGQTNPFGLSFDPLGDLYSADSHSKPVYLLLHGGYYEGIGKQHDGLGFAPRVTDDDHGSSAIGGMVYYADDRWPEEFRDNTFNGNVVTRRINRDKLEWHGSSPKAIRQPDFLVSDDKWFRPVNIKLGPDGALWIADFYNPIIGHYEVPLTNPHRDHAHGRIWRVVYVGQKTPDSAPATVLAPPPNLATLDPKALVTTLAAPNLELRRLATNELVDRVGNDAIPALEETASQPAPERKAASSQNPGRSEPIIPKSDFPGPGTATPAFAEKAEEKREAALTPFLAEATKGPPTVKEPSPAPIEPPHYPRIHSLWALERLGKLSDETIARALSGSLTDPNLLDVHVHAVRILGERPALGSELSRHIFQAMQTGSPLLRRVSADSFSNLLGVSTYLANSVAPLDSFKPVPAEDPELDYALRMALRNQLAQDKFADAKLRLADLDHRPEADRIKALRENFDQDANAALGAPTPEAAEFLLAYLGYDKMKSPRTADLVKHTALHLAADRIPAVFALVQQFPEAPLEQRVAIADGLLQAMRVRGIAPSPEASHWLGAVTLQALASSNEATVKRAIEAVRNEKDPAKLEPLSKIAADKKRPSALRAAALDSLANVDPAGAVLTKALADPSSVTLRKRAADLLGQINTPETRTSLAAALSTAPWDLATSIGGALAKSDAGAEALLAVIDAGKASPALLRNNAVAGPFATRAPAFKDRAATLTKDLPPEDARLDKVIAERTEAYRQAKPDANHGQQVFQQNCFICHRLKGNGGNIGPNLDGIASRGIQRLLEDILDPSRNVDPAFRQTILETSDGRTLAGVGLRENGQLLVMSDATGKEISVPKAQVTLQTLSRISLMPPGFEQTLSPTDLNDLVAYLMAQSDAAK